MEVAVENASARQQGVLILLPLTLLALVPVIAYFSPRALAVVPGLFGLISFIYLKYCARSEVQIAKLPVIFSVMIIALASLSVVWALEGALAAERGLKLGLILLPGMLLLAVAKTQIFDNHFFRRVFTGSVVVCGLLCCVDLFGNGALYRLLHEGDFGRTFNVSQINRSVNGFAMFAFIGLVVNFRPAKSDKVLRILSGMLAVTLVAVLYRTDSQSAQAALVFFALFYFFFPVARDWAWKVSAILIVIVMLVSPWVAQGLYNNVAGRVAGANQWASDSYMADRMEIWDMVSRKALESPVFGFGIEATREIDHFDTQKIYTPLDHVLHPHNSVLQIWIEFGVIGILLYAAIIVALFRYMSGFESIEARRLSIAVFVAMFFMMNTAYGLWQGWWLGLIFYLMALVLMMTYKTAPLDKDYEYAGA
ncbi:MAG: O-antigen ligase family protein [Micavibrio sp.]|nr:O-antigen ligase family protein [Micavibrio sp.]